MSCSPRPSGTVLLVATLIGVFASGCLEEGAKPTPTPPTATATGAGSIQPNNSTGCGRAFIASFPDKAHAQTFLPKGFLAGDSSEFFGRSGTPTGQGVLIVSAARCQTAQWEGAELEAMTGLFVRAPKINGTAVPGEHFYDLGRVHDDETSMGTTLQRLAWPRLGTRAQQTYAGEPTRAASVLIGDANGTVYAASLPAAAAKDPFTQTLHLFWWHETTTGLASFESTFRPDGYLGPGTCTMRSGSVPALIMRSTSCSALFMVGPPFSVVGEFHHRPDVHADP